jgi:nitrous oxidase accessory protein NosD
MILVMLLFVIIFLTIIFLESIYKFSKNCIIKNNRITAYGVEEQQIGNGIHCWKSDSLQIIGNTVQVIEMEFILSL